MDCARKCRWRKQEAIRVRKNRVTQGYIEKKHPEIYKEALEFYHFLDEKYPDKKDLRRTNEFEWLKTGISGQTAKKYYARKKTTTTTTTTTIVDDRMELIIPLMRKGSTNVESSQPPTDEQPHAEIVPYGEPAETVIDTTDTSNEEILDQEIMSTLNQEIPDHIIENIMTKLRSDPDLDTFFQTINDDFNGEELIYQ